MGSSKSTDSFPLLASVDRGRRGILSILTVASMFADGLVPLGPAEIGILVVAVGLGLKALVVAEGAPRATISLPLIAFESLLGATLPYSGFVYWGVLTLVPHLFIRNSRGRALLLSLVGAAALTGTGVVAGREELLAAERLLPILLTLILSALLVALFEAWRREEVRTREALTERLNTRNSMLSTLAHEVRTPLTVLQTSADLLLEEQPGPLNEKQRRLLTQIDGGVSRLIQFSNNLIASIKVDQGWFTLQLRPLDVRKTIKRVAQHVQPLLSQRNQELKLLFPSLLSRVPGDEQWLEQVIVNLIHNAAKYAEPGGILDVAVKENEQWVVISVGDNGAGIEGDERFQVFSEFYQGNPWSAAQLNGSGLGLAIVKRVVEHHGGEVYVGSVKNLGTIISFTLPKEESRG